MPVLFDDGATLSLLDLWSDRDAVVCIDACASLGPPGRAHRLELSIDPLPPQGALLRVTGWSLPRRSRALPLRLPPPPEVIVYAIEGRRFDPDAEPTAEAAAVAPVARRIAREVSRPQQASARATPHPLPHWLTRS